LKDGERTVDLRDSHAEQLEDASLRVRRKISSGWRKSGKMIEERWRVDADHWGVLDTDD
jgi:hypothetical protein